MSGEDKVVENHSAAESDQMEAEPSTVEEMETHPFTMEEVETEPFTLEEIEAAPSTSSESTKSINSPLALDKEVCVPNKVEPRELSCSLCEFKTTVQREYNHHRIKHFQAKKHRCVGCSFQTNDTEEFKQHCTSHRTPLPQQRRSLSPEDEEATRKEYKRERLMCPKCRFVATTEALLQRHRWKRHNKNTFRCAICDYITNEKIDLEKHLREHTESELLSVKTRASSSLDESVNNWKSGPIIYNCIYSKCLFSCKSADEYREHTDDHERRKNLGTKKMTICSVRNTPLNLVKQTVAHQAKRATEMEQRYNCNYCNYFCRQPKLLKEHERLHDPVVKPEVRYHSCTECNYRSRFRHDVKRHQVLHIKEKLFKCTQCSFTTDLSSSLKLHVRTHLGSTILQCHTCHYNTTDIEGLNRHHLTHKQKKTLVT